jgi:hypothetical protein
VRQERARRQLPIAGPERLELGQRVLGSAGMERLGRQIEDDDEVRVRDPAPEDRTPSTHGAPSQGRERLVLVRVAVPDDGPPAGASHADGPAGREGAPDADQAPSRAGGSGAPGPLDPELNEACPPVRPEQCCGNGRLADPVGTQERDGETRSGPRRNARHVEAPPASSDRCRRAPIDGRSARTVTDSVAVVT